MVTVEIDGEHHKMISQGKSTSGRYFFEGHLENFLAKNDRFLLCKNMGLAQAVRGDFCAVIFFYLLRTSVDQKRPIYASRRIKLNFKNTQNEHKI